MHDVHPVGVSRWIRSVPEAVVEFRRGNIRLVRDHVGERLTMSDSRTYVPFRNTVRTIGVLRDPVVLEPRFHLRFMHPDQTWRYRLFRRVCIVTTPFFVGLPGFRSKLWMVDPESGDFAGLYQWDGEADAVAYAEGLAKVLRALSVPGSVSYEVTAGMSVENYLKHNAR